MIAVLALSTAVLGIFLLVGGKLASPVGLDWICILNFCPEARRQLCLWLLQPSPLLLIKKCKSNVKVVKVLHCRTSNRNAAGPWCYTRYVSFKYKVPHGDVITLVHIPKVSSRWSSVQIKLGVLSSKTKVWQKKQRFMPWCSILSKDKSFPALYLPSHQYRRKHCEAKPHFLSTPDIYTCNVEGVICNE